MTTDKNKRGSIKQDTKLWGVQRLTQAEESTITVSKLPDDIKIITELIKSENSVKCCCWNDTLLQSETFA